MNYLNLGVALLPESGEQERLYDFTRQIHKKYALSFKMTPQVSVPHVSIFQGHFSCAEWVIEQLKNVELNSVLMNLELSSLSLWARKILFLNLTPNVVLSQLHDTVFQQLFIKPYCSGLSADPQIFQNITEGQRESFFKTGYPFSQKEYLPHFTVAHLNRDKVSDSEKVIDNHLNHLFKDYFGNLKQIIFTKLIVFSVGDLGCCQDIIFEAKI